MNTRPHPSKGAMRAALVLTFLFALPAVVAAQSRANVRVTDSRGRPLEGTVTFAPVAGGAAQRCRTRAGQCTLNVAPGSYRVTLAPSRERAPQPRTVNVAAGRTAVISLRALAEPTPAPTPRTRRLTPGRATMAPGTPTTGTTRPGTSGPTPLTPSAGFTAADAVRTPRAQTPSRTAPPAMSTTPASRGTTMRLPTPMRSTSASRDLARGTRLVAQGRVIDGRGRPAEARLTVLRGSRTVGTASTRAGQFSLYDLPAGTYRVRLVSSRGGPAREASLRISTGVARPTLRLP